MWLEMVQLGLNVFAIECTSWSTELDFQPSLKNINYLCTRVYAPHHHRQNLPGSAPLLQRLKGGERDAGLIQEHQNHRGAVIGDNKGIFMFLNT